MSQAWIQHTLSRKRLQTQSQATAIAILSVTALLILGSIYLSQVAAFAITNREIEDLISRRDELKQQNEQLIGEIASYKTVPRLYSRAMEIGFRPATKADIDHIFVESYTRGSAQTPPAGAPQASMESPAPAYDETFGGWLQRQLAMLRQQLQAFGG